VNVQICNSVVEVPADRYHHPQSRWPYDWHGGGSVFKKRGGGTRVDGHKRSIGCVHPRVTVLDEAKLAFERLRYARDAELFQITPALGLHNRDCRNPAHTQPVVCSSDP
jgi:hypothetical protein